MSVVQRLTSRVSGLLASNLGVVSPLNESAKNYFTYSLEPSQPLPKEPKWCTPEEAVQCIKSGDTVFLSGAASTPIKLAEAMAEHGKANKLKDITVCHMHTEGKAPYTDPECEGIFRSLSFFMAANVRKAVAEGRGDAIPIFLSEIPLLFKRGIIKPNVAIVQVSPPDEHGFCSLGTSVDCVRTAISNSKYIIAQVNKHMPRTFGDALVHKSHFDFACQVDGSLPLHPSKPPSPNEVAIGKHIAENLVENGATLQMGIGSIPDAVLSQLHNHQDLGLHTEMFADGVVPLVEKGCITNNKKPLSQEKASIGSIPDAVLSQLHNHQDLGLHTEMFADGVVPLVEKGCITNNKKPLSQGKIVASFLIGSQKLYDFIHNNPFLEMRVVDYVNDTKIISQHPKMTAINSCIEVDLTGQICADSIGTRMYSGFGGQVDFIRGAAEGFDGKGKPIIALQSSNAKTGESKIVPYLKQGAGVVTTRAHAHYVVTEHGIAYLFGKSLRQRAHALIQIAPPEHREALEKAAFERFKCMPSA